MKKTMLSGIALAALIALASPAAALSITNNDETNYTVIVTAGDQEAEIELNAGSTVETTCGEDCSLILMGADGDLDQMDAVEADSLIVTTGLFQKSE